MRFVLIALQQRKGYACHAPTSITWTVLRNYESLVSSKFVHCAVQTCRQGLGSYTMKLRVAGSFFTGSMGAAPKGRGVRWSIQLMLGKWMRFSGCSKRQQIKGTRRLFLFSGKFIISVRAWPRMHQWQ